LLFGVAAMSGMNGQGCAGGLAGGIFPQVPPAIIPTGPAEDNLSMSFTVDLRRFPDTHTVTWEFGDGSMMPSLPVASGRTVSHQYSRGGVFNVRVHLFSAPDVRNQRPAAYLATGKLPVDVRPPNVGPTALMLIADVLDDEGRVLSDTKQFSGTRSTDPDGFIERYDWDFGDGSHGTGATIEHQFTRTGRFVVRLTVTDDRGATATTTRSLVINLMPIAAFTFTETGNDGLSFRFDASDSVDADGSIVQFRWDFGDGSDPAFGQIANHSYAEPDDYDVTLRVTDDLGASDATTESIDVTGVVPFIRSVDPDFGIVDDAEAEVMVDGENFEDGATATLEMGATTIAATSVDVVNATTLELTFDLTGAELGDYDLVVDNPLGGEATLAAAYRVVTPNRVRLETSLGDVVIEMVDDAPITTANFFQYVDDDFFDGTIFHRIVPDFIVQGGGFLPGMIRQEPLRDPIQNEFSPDRSNVRGTLAMAKVGGDPDSATSQFFFNLDDNSDNLDNQNGGFTVFANVVEGMDVVDAIAAVPLNGEVPVDDVLLIRAIRE
jgi:cyclophilin family peptidyl-prolyl cis-trans isomerase/chitodextrinase